MFRKYLALVLTVLFLHTNIPSPAFGASNPKQSEAEKLKKKTEELGVGRKVKLRVKGPEIKGTIIRLEDDHVVIRDKVDSRELAEKYSDIQSIKKDGPSVGKWIALGAVGVLVISTVYSVALCRNEGC